MGTAKKVPLILGNPPFQGARFRTTCCGSACHSSCHSPRQRPTVTARPTGKLLVGRVFPQRISIKCRWNLAEEWLEKTLPQLWWDSAVPGTCTLDISLKRLMSYEASKLNGSHRVTVFIDLTTFYESVCIEELRESVRALGFPPLLLLNALRSYHGARVILSEQTISPPLFARRGLLAGCPLAPMLSKLALFGPCSATLSGNPAVDNADIWIDDISIDTKSGIHPKCPSFRAVTH